jgi:hypothetical protein
VFAGLAAAFFTETYWLEFVTSRLVGHGGEAKHRPARHAGDGRHTAGTGVSYSETIDKAGSDSTPPPRAGLTFLRPLAIGLVLLVVGILVFG